MKKLKISVLLNLLMVIFVVLIALQILFSIVISNNITGLSSLIYNHPFIVTNELKNVNINLNNIQNSLEKISFEKEIELKYDMEKINLYENDIEESLEIILEKFSGQKTLVLELKSNFSVYKKSVNEYLKSIYLNKRTSKQDSANFSDNTIKEQIDKIYFQSVSNAESFYKQIEKEKSVLSVSLIILISVSVLYAFIFLYITNIKVLNPLKNVINKIINITDGNNNTPDNYQKQNEIELLSRTVARLDKVTNDLLRENTERKKAEKMLTTINTEMKEIMMSKDKLFSIIAHDLKNPFNAILGFGDILMDNINTLDKTEIKEIINNIKVSAEHQYALLQNLLDWSRAQLDEFKIQKETLKLAQILDNVFNQVGITAKRKGVILINKVSNSIYVYTDKVIIAIILNNLISNAIKYSREKGNVIITACEEENYTTIKVTDEGCGIDESNLQKLFSIDKDLIKPGTDGVKGTGLGLIICKELVDKQNGKIWAESIPGKGSSFFFALPKFLFKTKLSF